MTERELAQRLETYLPHATSGIIARWIVKSGVHFRITMPRNSVYGDYMHPHAGKGHRITINGNLNAFSFLVTTVHEFAHLECWNLYGNSVKPHGDEWKREYKKLMHEFLEARVFPPDIDHALRNYMSNPAATSCSDTHLMKTLKRYDRVKSVLLADLPDHARFLLNDKEFIKGKKLRTRFECRQAGTNNIFLISETAEIDPLT